MFDKSAELYDLIYGQLKDYKTEVQEIHQLIAEYAPNAVDILDIGCGTGEHAFLLAQQYHYQADGIDIEPAFVDLAKQKHPGGEFTVGDMKDFLLRKEYDVILCLFSSIGYLDSEKSLQKALSCFRSHLRPDGLLIVEPWLEPGTMTGGKVYLHTAETQDTKVCRMSFTELVENKSILHFEYLVGNEAGISSFNERHEMTLFTREQLTNSFRAAGFEVQYKESGLSDRGIYLAPPAV